MLLLALGPTATVLAYDLSLRGFQAIDIGHIDIEYEWFLMKATKKVPIKNKHVQELGRDKTANGDSDATYDSQIVKVVRR